MGKSDIPDIVIGRLPVYLRALTRLQLEEREITSSHELGERLGISSAQIRKDLSHFGEFGKQGTGYHIATLSEALQRILRIDREWQVALVGAGDLGRALAHYGGFANRGFRITRVFDADTTKVGETIDDIHVQFMDELHDTIVNEGIKISMIATPADSAQEVASLLIQAGIKAILNYAPIVITVPADVRVQYIDPVIHLQRMTFYL
jgi:redox-sensing transcriptional repressor